MVPKSSVHAGLSPAWQTMGRLWIREDKDWVAQRLSNIRDVNVMRPNGLQDGWRRISVVTGLLCLLASANFSFSAHAASLRCDNALLQEGAHMYEVSQQCGEPVAQYSRLEFLHRDVPIYVDEWVYRFGTNKFERMLRFENGRLRDIRTLRKPTVSPTSSARGPAPSRTRSRVTGTVHRISH